MEQQMVGCVSQMAVFLVNGIELVKLWCRFCHFASTLQEDDSANIRIPKDPNPKAVLLHLESVAITRLICEDLGHEYRYRYLFHS